MAKIRVLVVDDSPFMRRVISEIISADPGMMVADTADNGFDAVRKTRQLAPDVITMDVQMPIMDGLEALRQIMAYKPTPVLMLSAFSKEGADITLDCLQSGAVDFVFKPGGTVSLHLDDVKSELLRKVRIAAGAKVKKIDYSPAPKKMKKPRGTSAKKLVCIVASTGAPSILAKMLPMLPPDLDAAVVVVQHMPIVFISSLTARLDAVCALSVKEAEDGELLRTGHIYLAPGGVHLRISLAHGVSLSESAPIDGLRPYGSLAMSSGAEAFGKDTIGVVLSGMGSDGLEGAKKVKEKGGMVLVQDEDSCVVFGMPKMVVDAKLADKVLPPEKIAEEIIKKMGRSKQ